MIALSFWNCYETGLMSLVLFSLTDGNINIFIYFSYRFRYNYG